MSDRCHQCNSENLACLDCRYESLADDPQAVKAWFGENIWAADDFGGLSDDTLVQLFDLILPGWAKFTWEGKRAAEGEQ